MNYIWRVLIQEDEWAGPRRQIWILQTYRYNEIKLKSGDNLHPVTVIRILRPGCFTSPCWCFWLFVSWFLHVIPVSYFCLLICFFVFSFCVWSSPFCISRILIFLIKSSLFVQFLVPLCVVHLGSLFLLFPWEININNKKTKTKHSVRESEETFPLVLNRTRS